MTDEACQRFKKSDAELNRVYRQILSVNARDANFAKAIREAQRAWILYRDAHVKAIFPDPDPNAYGSVNPMCRCETLEEITTQRTKELKRRWLEGFEEGDVCIGSGAVKRSRQ
jgi:uncharacterized protein YecT (DUF1311 family)